LSAECRLDDSVPGGVGDGGALGVATGTDPVSAFPAVNDVTTGAVASPAATPANAIRHFILRITSSSSKSCLARVTVR